MSKEATPSPSTTRPAEVGDSFLVFSERGAHYALPATLVRETLQLPRLSALDETAPWVLGAFDLRGELVPVVSPGLCLHHQPIPAATTLDLVIVAEQDGHPLAFRADTIDTLLPAERVLPVPKDPVTQARGSDRPRDATSDMQDTDETPLAGAPTRQSRGPDPAMIAYEIALAQRIVPVLEVTSVRLHAADAHEVADLPEQRLSDFERALEPAEQDVLSRRAESCRRIARASGDRQLRPWLVISIENEPFALPAEDCLEMARIGTLVPVPNTPAHILGFTALRGEVIALVDIRAVLNIAAHAFWEPPLMVVIEYEGHRTGIAVDAALGLTRAQPGPASNLPLALRTAGARWLRGSIGSGPADTTTNWGLAHPVALVDIPALLESGNLVVDARV